MKFRYCLYLTKEAAEPICGFNDLRSATILSNEKYWYIYDTEEMKWVF